MTGFLRLPIDRFGRFLYIGNILIHYLSFIGVIITLLFTFKRRYFKGMKLVICYVLNYVPYFYVRYVVSSSDYDTALIVAIMCFGVALDYVGWGTLRGFLMVIALTIAVIGFLIWAPIVYNVPLTEAEYRRKVWSLSW